MNPYLEIIRPQTALIAGLGAVAGTIIAGAPFCTASIYIFLTVFLMTGAGMAINDYYDLEIDKINAPHRPLPSGKISRKTALMYSLFLFLSSLVFGTLTNVYCFGLALFNGLVEFFYAKTFKKWWLMGNIMVSWLAGSVFLFGGMVTFDFRLVTMLAGLAFLANMGREIFKTIEDIKGDKAMNLDTLPIASGIKNAQEIARSFICLAVILSPVPYFTGLLKISYLQIVFVSDLIFIYSLFQPATKAKTLAKIAMFLVLLAILVSY
jgi:geranylgeranylglycerol-phosphate geranylgeranyltransferase